MRVFAQSGKRALVNQPREDAPEGAKTRYPFHSHEVRDTLITLHKKTGADSAAANFFAGHDIDRLKYDKSPWDDANYYRGEYLKLARPFLNPLSGAVLRKESELKSQFESRLGELERQMSEALARSR